MSNNDSTWYTLETWTNGDDEDNTWRQYRYDLSDYYFNSSTFYIAYNMTGVNQANDRFWVDEIMIYEGNISYIGTNYDTSDQADSWAEVHWVQNPGTSSSSTFVSYDISDAIESAGTYYLTLGAQVYKWDTSSEGANISFNNVSIYIE